MKKNSLTTLFGIMAAMFILAIASVVAAPPTTAPGHNKLLCFDGTTDGSDTYGGTCTMAGKGARGTATLNNNDGDPDGSYSGVYVENSVMYGQLLSDVTKLSFEYTGVATAGAPRFSVPIDTDGDGITNYFAFVSAYYCNDGAGLVDAINDQTCTIYAGADVYENWDAFAADNPTAVISSDSYVFIIADEPGMWTVSSVKFGGVNK